MISRLRLLRLWSDITGEWGAKGVAILGFFIFSLGTALDSATAIGIGSFAVAACIAWILRNIWKANVRRRHLAQSLSAALVSHGEVEAVATGDAFPDIPLWVGRDRIYCAGSMEVEVILLGQLVWAYAEMYKAVFGATAIGFSARYQLALWNRDAVATVLPVHKRFRDASLDRIRQAAPWIPVGYSEVMKESWNADHAEFLALVDSRRVTGKPFDAAWAGREIVRVLLDSQRPDFAFGQDDAEEIGEVKKLEQRWAKDEKA